MILSVGVPSIMLPKSVLGTPRKGHILRIACQTSFSHSELLFSVAFP